MRMPECSWVKSLSKYKLLIISAMLLFASLVASVYLFGELKPVIAAIVGLLFAIPIRFFWLSYTSPVLVIKEKPERRIIHLGDQKWEYMANRIIVENKGRSAAKNCKGYIVTKEGKERVCWTVPKERPNATINPKDEERLDFCAFYESGPTNYGPIVVEKKPKEVPGIIAPSEEGWSWNPMDSRPLNGIEKCNVLITADNTEPVDAEIRIDMTKGEIEIIAD